MRSLLANLRALWRGLDANGPARRALRIQPTDAWKAI
jgi:hypothetical protein